MLLKCVSLPPSRAAVLLPASEHHLVMVPGLAGQLPSALSERGSAAGGRGFVSHLCAGLPCPGFAPTHVMECPLAMPGAPDHTDVHAQMPHTCKYLCIILFDELNNWLFTDGKG